MFDGVQVFSATKHKERDELGDKITRWIKQNQDRVKIVDRWITQSSDSEYHCVTITLFYDYL